MNNLTHQFNDMDETHLAMSDPIELAKYIVELREIVSNCPDVIVDGDYDPSLDKLVDKEWLENLKEENNELKEEAEENKKLFDTTFSEFMKLKENLKSYEEVMMNIGDYMAPDEDEDYMWTHHGPEGIRDNLQNFIVENSESQRRAISAMTIEFDFYKISHGPMISCEADMVRFNEYLKKLYPKEYKMWYDHFKDEFDEYDVEIIESDEE